jgi:hypothetical protein
MALIGPRPIETVGYSQKSGISRGWGYEDSPHLEPEVVQLLLVQAALDERPGVDARRGVALEVHLVPGHPAVLAPEEVVEADLVEGGRTGVGGQVAADGLRPDVGPDHHHGGVPADEGADPALEVLVPRELGLGRGGDGVDVRRRDRRREADLGVAGPLEHPHEEIARPVAAVDAYDVVEGGQPFGGLLRVDVGKLVGDAVEEHVPMLPPGTPRLPSLLATFRARRSDGGCHRRL